MPELSPVAAVFNEAQRSAALHRRCAAQLKKLLKKNPLQFKADFMACIYRFLPVFKREPAVARLVQFVVLFSTEVAAASDLGEIAVHFAPNLVEDLLEYHNAKEKGVRLRVCELVAGVMNSMSEDAEITDSLWDRLVSAMSMRATDKVAGVREHAVVALKRLQDLSNPEDGVTQLLLCTLHTDSSKDVRVAVIQTLGVAKFTLPAVLEHVRDEKESVRAAAVAKLHTDLSVTQLKIAQRAWVVEQGLGDRSSKVQEATVSLLAAWLKECGHSMVEILRHMDVEAHEEVAGRLLRALFSHALELRRSQAGATDPDARALMESLRQTVAMDGLGPESALLWRVQCQWTKEESGSPDEVEALLPDVVVFCNLLRKYRAASSMEDAADGEQETSLTHNGRAFIFKQLLLLARYLDWADEAGRQMMLADLRGVLQDLSTDEDHIADTLRVLAMAHQGGADLVNDVAEMVNDLVDPLEGMTEGERETVQRLESQLERARARLERLQEEQEAFGREENAGFMQRIADAEEEVAQLAALAEDMASPEGRDCHRWERALQVTAELLLITRQTLRSTALGGLLGGVIVPAVQKQQAPLRALAVRCLGLFCLKEQEAAEVHVPLLVQMIENDARSVQEPALRALVDLQLAFPSLLFRVFEQTAEEAKRAPAEEGGGEGHIVSPHRVLGLLRSLAHWSAPPSLRAVAAEGLAKLLLTRRVQDDEALTLLLHLYFLPVPAMEELTRRGAEGSLIHIGRGAAQRAAETGLALDDARRAARGGTGGEDEDEVDGVFAEEDAGARVEAAAFAAARVRQCLSVFFPALAMGGEVDRRLIERVAISALRRLISAPGTSPLASIDVAQFAQYVLYLLQEPADETAAATGASCHDRVAIQLATEILGDPRSGHVRHLCKALASVQVSGRDMQSVFALRSLCRRLLDRVLDRAAQRSLEKVLEGLEPMLKARKAEHGQRADAEAGATDAALSNALQSLHLEGGAGAEEEGGARRLGASGAAAPRRTRRAAAKRAASRTAASAHAEAETSSEDEAAQVAAEEGTEDGAAAEDGGRPRRSKRVTRSQVTGGGRGRGRGGGGRKGNTPKRAKGNAGGNARSAPQGSDSASEEVSAEDVEATEVENSVASAAAGKSAVEPSYVAASPGALQAREKRVLNDLDNLLGESDTEA